MWKMGERLAFTGGEGRRRGAVVKKEGEITQSPQFNLQLRFSVSFVVSMRNHAHKLCGSLLEENIQCAFCM